MHEENVWDLSPALQSKPVFTKFTTLENTCSQSSLLWRLVAANSRDIM